MFSNRNAILSLSLFVLAILLMAPQAAHGGPVSSARSSGYTESRVEEADRFEKRVLVLINRIRKSQGKVALRDNVCLARTAQKWGRHLDTNNLFEHGDLRPYIRKCSMSPVGENLAIGYESPAAAVKGWMNSPGHKKNLLGSSYRSSGVNVTWDESRQVWIYTHQMGRPY